MKKYIYLVGFSVLIFSWIKSPAQKSVYHPFPESDVLWSSGCGGAPGDCCCSGGICLYIQENRDSLNGDTVIGSFTYKKLYSRYIRTDYILGPPTCPNGCSPSNTVSTLYSFIGAIRQDLGSRKVYFLPQNTLRDSLLYDFDLHLGDTLPVSVIPFSENNSVSKIDSVYFDSDGQYHKRFWLKYLYSSTDSEYVSIIEGIGSTYGLFAPLVPPFETSCGLNCVTIQSNYYYMFNQSYCGMIAYTIWENNENFSFKVVPNPAFTNVSIITNDMLNKATLTIYNPSGQLVKQFKNISGQTFSFDCRNFQNGMYYLLLSVDNNISKAIKLIIANE